MKLLGDNERKYSQDDVDEKLIELREKFAAEYMVGYDELPETGAHYTEEGYCILFQILDKDRTTEIISNLNKYTGNLKCGTSDREGEVVYSNDNYMIWMWDEYDDTTRILFSAKPHFTEHSLNVGFLCYIYGNARSMRKRGEYQMVEQQYKAIVDSHKEKATEETSLVLSSRNNETKIDWSNPKSIVAYLDGYVIGQQRAKKSLAITFSNFMVRKGSKDERLPLDHAMLIGPTGSGKTYMTKLLLKKAEIASVFTTASGKSTSGYKGKNLISSIINDLGSKTKDTAPYAAVFIDESDKILASKGGSNTGFSGGLQNEIISMIGGTDVRVEGEDRKERTINTKNILFFFAGAFHEKNVAGVSLWDIIHNEDKTPRSMGFTGNVEIDKGPVMKNTIVRPKHLIKYGAAPELIGRVSALCTLDELNENELVEILTTAKNSVLEQYTLLMEKKSNLLSEEERYTVKTSEDLPQFIVDHRPKNTGARSLRDITIKIFNEIIWDPKDYIDTETRTININVELAKDLLGISNEESGE